MARMKRKEAEEMNRSSTLIFADPERHTKSLRTSMGRFI
jgi:hypothetical protein